ncbi:hypothetical protein EXM22_10485 [Oceanispirochaeta crateris]|uniref:Uncharacterized protein n=1 Tax=Oceanispirochaeta crateris TaxID=2518645 RepID=A0A5C1QM39_9SPIO|nr:hypothetical protein [Oceanispirochaeta crateris]QEN08388.1 hypothetical protein EXM22_10485 [Oceanispirochaeta crateris]
MKQWIDALDLWVKEGPVNALSKEELQTIEAKASQRVERGEKNQRRRQIWRQKNTFFMITAITVILLGVIVGTPIRKSLEPPVTMGMEAREVIHSYYDGFNTMNQEIMEDSIDKKVGKGDLTEVTNFFVTSRVRMGYEGKSGVLSAAEWVASGRPELESGINLYGVAELSIEDLGEGQFRVSYEKWIPGSSNEIDQVGPIPPEGYFVTDLVTLEKQKKGNWLIVGLNRSLQKITE